MVHKQVDLELRQFPMGRAFQTPLDRPRADIAGFRRLSKHQGAELNHGECQRAPREND